MKNDQASQTFLCQKDVKKDGFEEGSADVKLWEYPGFVKRCEVAVNNPISFKFVWQNPTDDKDIEFLAVGYSCKS